MTVFHQLVKDFLEAMTPYDFVCCLDGIEVGYQSGFLVVKKLKFLCSLQEDLMKILQTAIA